MNQIASKKKLPVFGSLSIVFPVFGVLIGFMMEHTVHGNGEGWAEFVVFCHYFSVGVGLGFISALVSFIRRERFLFLPVVGIIINAAPVVFVWYNSR